MFFFTIGSVEGGTLLRTGKVALLSVGEKIDTRSAAGRLVLNVLASVSQWDREAIGERTAMAMQHKAKQGEYTCSGDRGHRCTILANVEQASRR